MVALALLCLAAAALVAFMASAGTYAGVLLVERRLENTTAAARARVLLGAAVLPLMVTVAVLTASLAPWFGWIADHCGVSMEVHVHPHICEHYSAAAPALPLIILAGVFGARVAWSTLRFSWLAASAGRTRRALLDRASRTLPGQVRVLPIDEPQAFVLGVLRPCLFVTRGLLASAHRDHLAAVLAHERAHMARGDGWRLAIASVALAFHLPVIAGSLQRRLVRAHEMAADDVAADTLGSRTSIARALVHLARSRVRLQQLALAFGALDVELRVRALLAPVPRRSSPGPATLFALAAILLLGIGASAGAVHHTVEQALGLFGG